MPAPAPPPVEKLEQAITDLTEQTGDVCGLICSVLRLEIESMQAEYQEVERIPLDALKEIIFDIDATLTVILSRIQTTLSNFMRDLSYDMYWASPYHMEEFFPDGPPPPPLDPSPTRRRSRKSDLPGVSGVAVDTGSTGEAGLPGGGGTDPNRVGPVRIETGGAGVVNVNVTCPDTGQESGQVSAPLPGRTGRRSGNNGTVDTRQGPAAMPGLVIPSGLPGDIGAAGFVAAELPGAEGIAAELPGPDRGDDLEQLDTELGERLRANGAGRTGFANAEWQYDRREGSEPTSRAATIQTPEISPLPDVEAAEWAEPAGRAEQYAACHRLVELRSQFAAIGAEVMIPFAEGRNPTFVAIELTEKLALSAMEKADEVGEYLRAIRRAATTHEGWGTAEAELRAKVEEVTQGRYDLSSKLKAAVMWFEMLESYAYDWSRSVFSGERINVEVGEDVQGGLGFNFIVKLGAEMKGRKVIQEWGDHARSVNVTAKAKLIVVAMLEMARWFARNADLVSVPTIAEAIGAYLRGGLSGRALDCLLNLNGAAREDYDAVIHSVASKLSPFEIIGLYRRGKISPATMWQKLRGIGFLSQQDAEGLYSLTDALPPVSDLIRFMVRDVEDSAVVKAYDLDAEFSDKWRERLKEWGFSQGIGDDVALRYWRAHWDYPSNTQLFEMFHRLRPDKPDVRAKEIAVTIDDVKNVLAINDTLPFWRERLAAVSYHPLTRVDAQRMRMTGVLDHAGLVDAFRDLGYDATNAERLAQFTDRRRHDFLLRARPSRLYAQGALSRDSWREQIGLFKVDDQEQAALLSTLDAEARAKSTRACLKAIRKEYLTGGYDKQEVTDRLAKENVPLEQRAILVDQWTCEKSATEKQIPAAQLCKWFAQNLITEEQYRLRLVRLGYSPIDTVRLVAMCRTTEVQRITSKKERESERQAKDVERRKKAMEAAEARKKATEARAQRTLDKEATAEARRKAKLRKAALNLAGLFAGTSDEGARMIADATAYLMETWLLSQTEAEALVLDAVKYWDGSSLSGWRELIDDLAEQDAVFDAVPEEAGKPAGPIG